MALAETADLLVQMNMKGNIPQQSARFSRAMQSLRKDSEKTRAAFSKIGQGLRTGFKRSMVIGAGAIGILALAVRGGIDSLAELQDVQNATQQALKTTHHVAGQTAKGIRALSSALEDQTTVDDKLIQKGANLLLTFTHVRKNAFKPALVAALDLNAALGKGPEGLNSTITLVGKALNDPIVGLTTLRRVGVSFTAAQQKQIKALVASGHIYKAQKIILGELGKEYGGRATAAAKGYRGQLNRLNDAFEDMRMAIAKPLLKPLTKITAKLAEFAKSKDVQDGLKNLGETVAGLFSDENIQKGGEALKGALTFLKGLPWDTINEGFSKTADIAKKALDIFNSLPPDVKGALITLLAANKLTGGLVASGLKDLIGITLGSLKTITAGNVVVVGANVTSGAPGGGIPPVTGGAPSILSPLVALPAIAASLATSAVILAAAPKTPTSTRVQGAANAQGQGGIFTDSSARLIGAVRDLPGQIADSIGAFINGGGGASAPNGPGRHGGPAQFGGGGGRAPQGSRPTPGPSQGVIPTNPADPNLSQIVRNTGDTPRAIHGLQAVNQADAQFQRTRLDALRSAFEAKLAGLQAAAAVQSISVRAGIAAAVASSGAGVQSAIRTSRPIVNTYVSTSISATAVANGVHQAASTHRVFVS